MIFCLSFDLVHALTGIDDQGQLELSFTSIEAQCGRHVQVLDVETCTLTDVFTL